MMEWKRLANNAEDFRSAAAQLLDVSGSREAPNLAFPASIIVLTGYAWELFFKAYLAKADFSEEGLKEYRYNLSKLRETAEAEGWNFNDTVIAAKGAKISAMPQPSRDEMYDRAEEEFYEIWRMTDSPTDFAVRYPMERKVVDWPEAQLEIINVSLEELRN